MTQIFDLFLATLFSLLLAFLGGLAKLIHEHAHGDKLTGMKVLLMLPSAVILGVVGSAIGGYLHAQYQFPAETGGAVAGLLAYLGPTVISTAAAAALQKWGGKGNGGSGENPPGKG